ncbi:MAG: glyoxalase [Promethearchaeota archaeon Loki_b32]|nr:MAG: glyoxalase [Candidatus Lokiarchaeota archaeon Loki_b32]
MPKINHFEINADDPLRAKSFYENVFKWKIEKWEGPLEYWLISAGDEDEPGINGGLQKRENKEDAITNYITVKSVDDIIKKIEENGGKIIKPKSPIPRVGYYAIFKDTEGNRLDLMEEDESAK